jgi:hypothetical protein
MPTQKEFDDLKALVERIAATPKVKAYLDGGAWPRKMSHGQGVIEPVNEAALAVPKSKDLVRAELAADEAQRTYDGAKDAWLAASRPESGTFLHDDGMGSRVVTEVVATPFWSGRIDIPEYQAMLAAERALIAARVKMFARQKRREQEMLDYERRKNPPKNVAKSDGPIARVVKLAAGVGR